MGFGFSRHVFGLRLIIFGGGAMCGLLLVREARLSGKSPNANLAMRGLAAGFANCWRRSVALWDKAFRWFARIGPIPRPLKT
jgi:hypothetical protein